MKTAPTFALRMFTLQVFAGATRAFANAGRLPGVRAKMLASKFLSSLTRLNGHGGRALSMTTLRRLAESVRAETKPETFGMTLVKRALPGANASQWERIRLPRITVDHEGDLTVQIAKRAALGTSHTRRAQRARK